MLVTKAGEGSDASLGWKLELRSSIQGLNSMDDLMYLVCTSSRRMLSVHHSTLGLGVECRLPTVRARQQPQAST